MFEACEVLLYSGTGTAFMISDTRFHMYTQRLQWLISIIGLWQECTATDTLARALFVSPTVCNSNSTRRSTVEIESKNKEAGSVCVPLCLYRQWQMRVIASLWIKQSP